MFRLSNYFIQYHFLYRNIAFMLESIHSKVGVKVFFQLSFILLIIGILVGTFVFTSLKGVLVLGLIFGLTPYVFLRMRLMGAQMKMRIDFLPAVEVFYQYYVLSETKNLRNVLKKSLTEQKILYPIKPIFEQLDRNLSTQRDTEDCFRIFSLSFGHRWADYFINIIRIGLLEGVDIKSNLKELIVDMRKAQRADQVERNRLLEIRIANFTPILFLAVFLFLNFQINYHNAYYYYMIDAEGRNMLLDAMLLIFVSFIMGLYLSIKRM